MLKLDKKALIWDLDGNPKEFQERELSKDGTTAVMVTKTYTIGEVCEAACFIDDGEKAPTKKTWRWNLANKIHTDEAPELTAEDVVLLKELIAKGFSTALAGPALEILEGRAILGKEEQKVE